MKVPIILSSCLNQDEHIRKLEKEFGKSISYSLIPEKHTVNITFNKTVQEYLKRKPEPEGWLYIDSGCQAPQKDTFSYMASKTGFGMVSCVTDTDQGFWAWMEQPLRDTIVPVGKSLNLHFQIFHHDIQKRFGRIIPDIFRSFCTESTFPYLNAAINREHIVLMGRVIKHICSVDGASSGFGDSRMGWTDVMSGSRGIDTIINDPEGTACGFGYEECGGIKMHNPDAYEGNFCKDPERLARFIQDNIYLPKFVLDYDSIKCEWL